MAQAELIPALAQGWVADDGISKTLPSPLAHSLVWSLLATLTASCGWQVHKKEEKKATVSAALSFLALAHTKAVSAPTLCPFHCWAAGGAGRRSRSSLARIASNKCTRWLLLLERPYLWYSLCQLP